MFIGFLSKQYIFCKHPCKLVIKSTVDIFDGTFYHASYFFLKKTKYQTFSKTEISEQVILCCQINPYRKRPYTLFSMFRLLSLTGLQN